MAESTSGGAGGERSYLKEVFENQCKKYNEGLVVVSLPTGIGKTHAYRQLALDMLMRRIEKAMAEKVEKKTKRETEWFERDFYVVTNLKKNLEYEKFVEEARAECFKRYENDPGRLAEALDYIRDKVRMFESKGDYAANYLVHCDDDEYSERMKLIEDAVEGDDKNYFKNSRANIKFLRDRLKYEGKEYLDEESGRILGEYTGRLVRAASGQAAKARRGQPSTWPRKWTWLREMHKDMFWGTSWVSFLTNKKAASVIDTVEKRHPNLFLDSDIKGAIIVMDEYDASMNDILSYEMENALKVDYNLVSIVRNTCLGLRTHPNESIFAADDYIRDYNAKNGTQRRTVTQTYEHLRDLCGLSYEQLSMSKLTKSVIPDGMDKTPSAFVFTRSNSLIVVAGTGGAGIKDARWSALVEIDRNKKDGTNRIIYTQKDPDALKNAAKAASSGVEILGVGQYVGKCHTYIDNYIDDMARIILEDHSQAVRNAQKAKDEGRKAICPNMDSTIQSILNMFGTDSGLRAPIASRVETLRRIGRARKMKVAGMRAVQEANEWTRRYNRKPDSYDPYMSGLRFTSLYESDNNRYQTEIHYYSIPRMPESYIVSAARGNLLFCGSATAGLYNPIGNYDDCYIRLNLGELYRVLDESEMEKIRETQKAYNRIRSVDENNPALHSDPGYKVEELLHPEVGKQLPCYASALPYHAKKRESGSKGKLNAQEKISMAREMLRALCEKIECPLDVDDGADSEVLADRIVAALGDENDWFRIARYFRFFQSYAIFRRSPGSVCIGFYNVLANGDKFALEKLQKLAACSDEICERSGRGYRPVPSLDVLKSKGFEEGKKGLAAKLLDGSAERAYVLTTYQTVGAGQNLYYAVSGARDVAIRVGRPSKTSPDGYAYVDADTLYLDEPTHVLPLPPEKGAGHEKRSVSIAEMAITATRIYECMANSGALPVNGSAEYDACIRRNIQKALCLTAESESDADNGGLWENEREYDWPSSRKTSGKMKQTKKELHYTARVAGIVIQALGRMSRTNGKRCVPMVMYDPELASIIKHAKLSKHEIYNVETVAMIESACAYGMDKLNEDDKNLVEKNSRIATEGRNAVRDVLSELMSGDGNARANAVVWAWMREMTLAYPVIDADLVGEALWNRCGKGLLENVAAKYGAADVVPNVSGRARRLLEKMYVDIPEGCSYWFTNVDYGTSVRVYHRQDIADCLDADVYRASPSGARLDKIMESKEIKSYFESRGYATSFPTSSDGPRRIIAPEYYQSVYKGALGEVAGEYMLNKTLRRYGLKCAPMPFEHTETMDSAIVAEDGTPTGIYVDYKNWSSNSSLDTTDILESYKAKTKKLSSKLMVVVNMYDPDSDCRLCSYGNGTSVVSGVFGPGGEVRTEILEQLCENIGGAVERGDVPEDENLPADVETDEWMSEEPETTWTLDDGEDD